MNRIRKRFSRWGGGKLARALSPALVRVYIVSDVIGDDLASIGSGPCVPDPTTASEVRQLLERAGLWSRIPESARRFVASAESGNEPETPKPGDPTFARVTLELVASNRLALEAAAKRAAELGLAPRVVETPLAGEASTAGASVAASLLNNCVRSSIPQPTRAPVCLIWGGETTVTLGENPTGLGGRSQELALAAARVLDGGPASRCWRQAPTGATGPPTRPAPSSTAPPGRGSMHRVATRSATSRARRLSGARFGGRAAQAGTHRHQRDGYRDWDLYRKSVSATSPAHVVYG